VALLGLSERVRTPGPPVDWIGLVLQQIRTRLMGEAVFMRMGSCGGHGFRRMPKSADWQNLPIGMSALDGLSANRKSAMYNRRDTIFALSSGRPPAAIAVVRVSGPAAKDAIMALAGRVPQPR